MLEFLIYRERLPNVEACWDPESADSMLPQVLYFNVDHRPRFLHVPPLYREMSL